MTLLNHMKGLSDIIGYVLMQEQISARCLRVKQGPLTLSFKIQLLNPKRGDDDRVLRLASMLESYSGVGPVRVSRDIASIIIEFPSPDPVTPHASLLAQKTKGSMVCVGFDRWGEPVYLTLPSFPNLLVSGPPRSGKSSAMRSLVYASVKSANQREVKVNFAICAEKTHYWEAFRNIQGFSGLFSTQEETNAGLSMIVQEMRQLVSQRERFRPALVVVLDDLTSLLSGNSELSDDLSALVTTGGSAGCYVLIGTQTTGSRAGTGGQKVEDSIMARLIYRTSSRSAAARSTGGDSKGIDQLSTVKGDALFVLGEQATRVATGYVTDEDIVRDLPKRTHSVKYVLEQKFPKIRGVQEEVQNLPIYGNTDVHPLPKIKPARRLTEEEAQEVRSWVEGKEQKGEGWSKRQLLFALFDGKNDKLSQYLDEALQKQVV